MTENRFPNMTTSLPLRQAGLLRTASAVEYNPRS
jgi:hypothetical protein